MLHTLCALGLSLLLCSCSKPAEGEWITLHTRFFQFTYPKQNGLASREVVFSDNRRSFNAPLGESRPISLAGKDSEKITLHLVGSEYDDSASCAELGNNEENWTILRQDPLVLHDDYSDQMPSPGEGKRNLAHRYRVIGADDRCLDITVYDVTAMGYRANVRYGDDTDAGQFLKKLGESLARRP